VVANGLEVLEAVAQYPYDFVLMDCQMPEMDGYAATAAIRVREQQTGCHIPIVAMTANAMQGDREACLDAGMDDYVSKPVQSIALLAMIQKWGKLSAVAFLQLA
jgi:CheY-like chemotaxis protein